MTRNFVGGLIARPQINAQQISVFDRNAPKNEALASDYGIGIASSAASLINDCDIIVIAVKPQGLKSAIAPLVSLFAEQQPLVISLAAGTTIKNLEALLNENLSIVRAMPNAGSLYGLGATGLLANSKTTNQQRELTQFISDSVGISAWVNSDADIDSITALSGSGPAYFLLFIDYLAKAANNAGIAQDDALRFATQTAIGAAKLIEHSEHSIGTLVDGICSKGGTTEQAVKQLKSDKLSEVVERAFDAAKRRSEELASSSS